jgi:peptidoglycan/xylan/chitin deacetylase (PgdA/CDA1 family)
MNDRMVYLMLVVHTEPPLDATGKSLPMIARISHSHRMPVTWVVTHDVALDFGNPNCKLSKVYGFSLRDFCIGVYDESGIKDEVGAHLHPEIYYGIKYRKFKNGTSSIDNYAINRFTEEEQYKLIEELTNTIADCVDIRPKTFVAGRWAESGDGTTLRTLEKLGYTADVNLPFYKPVGKSDWTGARYYQPYHPNRENILQLGESRALIIPQTVLPPKISMSWKSLILTDDKVLWPTVQSEDEMQNVFEWYYKLSDMWSTVAMVIYMHSHEGGRKDVLQRLDWLLSYASSKGNVVFVTPQEYVGIFIRKYGGKNPEKVYSIPAYMAFLAKISRSLWISAHALVSNTYHILKRV